MAQDTPSAPLPTAIPPAGVNGPPAAAPGKARTPKKKSEQPDSPHDTKREIAETVVFVVILVLLLKLFVAEAFVIPTGSMATTLWGNQYDCTCRECGYKFPVGALAIPIPRKNVTIGSTKPGTSAKIAVINTRVWKCPRNFPIGPAAIEFSFPRYEYHLRSPPV